MLSRDDITSIASGLIAQKPKLGRTLLGLLNVEHSTHGIVKVYAGEMVRATIRRVVTEERLRELNRYTK